MKDLKKINLKVALWKWLMLFKIVANPIEKTLRSAQMKNICLFALLFFFARFVGTKLVLFGDDFTLGGLTRILSPLLVFMFLVSLVVTTDLSSMCSYLVKFEWPNFTYRQVIFIAGLALVMAPVVCYAGSNIAMVNNLIMIFVIIGFLVSLHASIKYGTLYGVIGFILLYPFLCFIQKELGHVLFKDGFNFGPLVLNHVIIFLLILVFVSLLSQFVERKSWGKIPLYKAIAIYLLVFFASVILSDYFNQSLERYLLEIIYPVLFYVLVVNHVKTDRDIKLIVYALIFSAIMYCFLDFYFLIKGGSVAGISDLKTMHGSYFMGGERELFLLLTFPLALSLYAISLKVNKLIFMAASLIMVAFMLFSYNRIAVIALGASLLVFFRNKRVMVVALSLIMLALIFKNWTLQNIFSRFSEFNSIESLHPLNWSPMRYHGWIAALDMIKDYPWHGVGFGLWGSYYYKYGPSFTYILPGIGQLKIWIAGAHNAFLDIATETGIPGLIAWLILMMTILKETFCVWRIAIDKTRKVLALGCMSSMIAFWVICSGGGYPSVSADNRFGAGMAFWTMVAVLFAIKRLELSKCSSLQESVDRSRDK